MGAGGAATVLPRSSQSGTACGGHRSLLTVTGRGKVGLRWKTTQICEGADQMQRMVVARSLRT